MGIVVITTIADENLPENRCRILFSCSIHSTGTDGRPLAARTVPQVFPGVPICVPAHPLPHGTCPSASLVHSSSGDLIREERHAARMVDSESEEMGRSVASYTIARRTNQTGSDMTAGEEIGNITDYLTDSFHGFDLRLELRQPAIRLPCVLPCGGGRDCRDIVERLYQGSLRQRPDLTPNNPLG
ncbi:unnamed protein product [Pleuronectes platessa]|uniref:Uncharacterized protein n=1 Tax=Pleuronectes platessa TaxID=8262 RepID=A0A9N7UBH6_PLEPL|nr:unnamed protein product [Pleuronectes platessa]